MSISNDTARCPGWGDGPEDWLEECHDCQRRTAPPSGYVMQPPQIVTFICENYIPSDRLARQQGLG